MVQLLVGQRDPEKSTFLLLRLDLRGGGGGEGVSQGGSTGQGEVRA